MNIKELIDGYRLRPLAMRAWLTRKDDASSESSGGDWLLEDCWAACEDPPSLRSAHLHVVDVDGLTCLAVVARTSAHGESPAKGSEERPLVYVLNPADGCVWDAIEGWRRNGLQLIRKRSGMHEQQNAPLGLQPFADFSELRIAEGEELESDLLAGKLQDLMYAGRLELVLAFYLDLPALPYCAIVETPMMCKSITPGDRLAHWEYLDHQYNKWRLEGIWS